MHKVMDSNHARLHWRDVLDASAKGLDIVITRYNKPASIVINYEDYIESPKSIITPFCQRSALQPDVVSLKPTT